MSSSSGGPPIPAADELFRLLSEPGPDFKMEQVRRLLSQFREVVAAKGRFDEESPLHVAAAEGHVEAVQLLIKHGATVNQTDNVGYTPLHWAAGRGHKDVIKVLIGAKADVNAVDKNNITPLHRAAYWGQTDAVRELLVGGANPNTADRFNHTPFMMATWFGKLDAAREIFDKMDQRQITMPNAWGKTPLEWARESNRQEVEAFILRRYRVLGIMDDKEADKQTGAPPLSNQSSPYVPASPAAMTGASPKDDGFGSDAANSQGR